MAIEIKVPQLPESVADATVATWHVKPGDKVSRDQNLVDIETDKVVLEVVAPADGVIGEILAEEGATVVAEEVIGKLVEGEGAVAAAAAPASTAPSASASSSGEKLEVKVPQLPESVADATVATWHVKPGDAVTRDQNLVDIETDKVVLEVVAAADGVLSEVLHAEGATVTADEVIGIITAGAVATASEAPAAATTDEGDSEVAGPAVRRMLAEHGLQVADVKGTGKGGRVTKEDVENHLSKAASASAAAAPAAPASAPVVALGDREQKRVPMTRLRKTIAKRLLEAKNATAMLTTFNEVNMKPRSEEHTSELQSRPHLVC